VPGMFAAIQTHGEHTYLATQRFQRRPAGVSASGRVEDLEAIASSGASGDLPAEHRENVGLDFVGQSMTQSMVSPPA
jgi:hypothetical protein